MPVWDVAALPKQDQFDYWHAVICRAFVPLTPVRTGSDAGSGVGFPGRVETRELGALTRARIDSQAQHTRHGPREVAATDQAWFFVNLQLAGRCRVRVGDRTDVVEPGQFVVVDTAQPYWFDMDSAWRMVSFRLPHSRLPVPRREATGVPVAATGAGGVVTSLMQALWDVGDDAPAEVADGLAQSFASAVSASLGAGAGGEPVGREALRAAVLDHVGRHLTDRDLSVRSVCRQFAVSPRTLHNAFADGGEGSFAAIVRARRLDRCAGLLADPAVHSTVTAVALGHGFDDATSFARAFRRRFGVSPREVRAGACTNGTVDVR